MPVSPISLRLRNSCFDLSTHVHLMGILNVTPDSFSDGGLYVDVSTAVQHAIRMVEEGADLIDIGAESTRPSATPVDEAEELRRLLPVVREVCRRVTVPVSIDTTKATVAERALDLGATLINDVSALRSDPGMPAVVARSGAGIVLMHMRGTPQTMQQAPAYDDVVSEIRAFLRERVQFACEAGIETDRILLDPGIGFGKNLGHNVTLLAHLDAFTSLERPLLVGVSRKAFLGTLSGQNVEHRMTATAAAVTAAVLGGARMVRVHEVAAMRAVVRVAEAVRNAGRSQADRAPCAADN